MPHYDYLIVGAGLFGSVFARQMTDAGRKCLVIDKRSHIGGNCFTESLGGIDIHRYGPHIFHTNSQRVWDYARRFAEFHPYRHKVKACCRGRLYSLPVNLTTLHQLWGVTTPGQARAKLDSVRESIANPANLEEWALSQVGRDIYELFFHGYTQKQWGTDPRQLPASILKRLPIRLNFNDDYFDDRYQGIPIGGYTAIFEKLLDGVEVWLDTDYFADRRSLESLAAKIVYTGMIDRFFNCCRGELDWRTLRFETQNLPVEDFQGGAIVNHCDVNVPFTRVTEFKHFMPPASRERSHTIITREYPQPWSKCAEPYYPINSAANEACLAEYRRMTPPHVIFGGRLGDYRYYDMHQVIGSAIARAEAETKPQAGSHHPESVVISRTIIPKAEPMKLIYACSPSHRVLRDEVLLPSLERVGERWKLIEISCPQVGKGDFKSSDWNASVQARIEGLRRIVSESAGQIVVLSDVDVQFFRPVQALALQCLGDRDAVFQMEDATGAAANLGFAVLRCGPALCALLDLLCDAVARGQWDQGHLNELIAHNAMPCRFGFLPSAFANDKLIPGDGRPPAGMVLYHSILTFPKPGTPSVTQKLQRHRAMASRLNDRSSIAGIDAGLWETRPSRPRQAHAEVSHPLAGRPCTLFAGMRIAAANIILCPEGKIFAGGAGAELRLWRPEGTTIVVTDTLGRQRRLVPDRDGEMVSPAAGWSGALSRRWRGSRLRPGRAAAPGTLDAAWRLVPQPALPANPARFQIVVAKFREDIRWIDALGTAAQVYSKCPEDAEFTRLPNVGREFGTYLYHIVRNYDRLAERTLFVQGDPFPHDLLPLHCYAEQDGGFVAEITRSIDIRADIPWSSPGQRIGETVTHAFLELVNRPNAANPARWPYGAQFSVSRQVVHQYPREYYCGLLETSQSEHLRLAGVTLDNIHIGFLFEMFWREVFAPPKETLVTGDQTGDVALAAVGRNDDLETEN